MKKWLSLLLIILSFTFNPSVIFAQSLDDELSKLEREITQLAKQKEDSVNATKPLEGELAGVTSQITSFNARIAGIGNQIKAKEQEVVLLEKNIGNRQEELALEQLKFVEQIKQMYIRDRAQVPLSLILSAQNAGDLTNDLSLETTITQKNLASMSEIGSKLVTLQTDKDSAQKSRLELASAQSRLQVAKKAVDERASVLAKTINEAKKHQENLSSKITELSAKQQSILSAKNGTFVTGVGDVPLPDDPNASPAYNPGFSPAFGAFSFGGFTHRKGMSQYGAKGRAESGQTAVQILQAYYGKPPISKDTGGTIKVEGKGDINFEDNYLLGIAEMPASFPKEALKAQAIAARSYAWRYKKDGKSICTTEACQVYSAAKAASSPQAWRDAVQATRGQVIEDVVTYYSSTTGGYLNTSGWDTTDGQGGPGFASRAWESKAKSPWFYKGWYTEKYSISSGKCGRSHPWLNQEEMADILNTYLIQGKGGVDNGRITPTTTSCWGGNPYSYGEARDLANSVGGGAVTSISSVSVVYGNNGQTSTVTFGTNRGSLSINGAAFKETFNLRAPGFISIKSVLYNIEKK